MGNSISQIFYVYTLAYPESMGGMIFYVGKGKTYDDGTDRIDVHEEDAKRGVQSKKCDAIREIWTAGEQVVKKKVAYFSNEEDAYTYEWGLINMTTYAESLTNILRGKGYPRRLDIDSVSVQQYGPICLQKWQRHGKGELIIYHKVSDIVSFCEQKSIKRKMLINVLEGKTTSVNGYSLVPDCDCGHSDMALEKRPKKPNTTLEKRPKIEKRKMEKRPKKPIKRPSPSPRMLVTENMHPLRAARLMRGLTLDQCAKALNLSKSSYDAQIITWEYGRSIPRLRSAARIAEVLGFSSPEEVQRLCREWRAKNIKNQ